MTSVAVTAAEKRQIPLSRDQRGALGLIAGGFLALGLLEGTAGALWPDVIEAFDVSKGAFGFASGIGLCAALPVLIFGGRITTMFDKRTLLAISAAAFVAISVGFTVGHALLALAVLLLARGISIALIDLACNALAMEVENQTGRHLMSPLHSGFSAGTVIGAGFAWVVFEMGSSFRAVYLVLAALLVTYTVLAVRERVARPMPRRRTEIAGTSISLALFRRPEIRILTIITGVSFSAELLIAQWIGIYLRDELGFSASTGVRAVILLGASMFLGRVVNQPVTSRLGARLALLIQGTTLTAGGVLLVATDSAFVSTIGCGVAGLGIAGIAPTALSLAGIAVPTDPGAASGAMLMGGYAGIAVVPFVAGALAELASVRVVMLVEIVFGMVVLLSAVGLNRWVQPVPDGAPG